MIVESVHQPVAEHVAAGLIRLCTHFEKGKDLDVLRTYARALERRGVTAPELDAAIEHTVETRVFFPSLSELLDDVDHVRLARRDTPAFTPCAACELHPGWIEVEAKGE